MSIQHLFAGVAAADYPALLGWYERLFGRRPDVIVKQDEAMWQLTGEGWIYVFAAGDHVTGAATITVLVDDLDFHLRELSGRGIDGGAIEEAPGRFRRVKLTDPEGNTIAIGEAPRRKETLGTKA